MAAFFISIATVLLHIDRSREKRIGIKNSIRTCTAIDEFAVN